MKRMAIIGGIVIVLIAVIKIGSIFIAPSEEDPTESQTSTQETSMTVEPGTTTPRELVTIEIENGGDGGNDALETLPTETEESSSLLESGQSSTAASPASTTKAPASFTVKDIESKTMYAIKSVRVRESASTDSSVVGGLTPGQDVKATGETSNGWIRVSYNGSTAYVSKAYLSTNKEDVVKETTAAKKSTTSSGNSTNTTKTTKAAQESIAPTPTTAAPEETIAPFPG